MLAMVLVLATTAVATPPLTLAGIAAYEATFGTVPWPAGAASIDRYDRWYSRAADGHIFAQFRRRGAVDRAKPAIVIVPADKAEWVMDGGCSVLNVHLYGLHDPRNRIDCGGLA